MHDDMGDDMGDDDVGTGASASLSGDVTALSLSGGQGRCLTPAAPPDESHAVVPRAALLCTPTPCTQHPAPYPPTKEASPTSTPSVSRSNGDQAAGATCPGLEVRLLGRMQIVYQGETVTKHVQQRSRELLAVLATARRPVGRVALEDALWCRGRLRPAKTTASSSVHRLCTALKQATGGAVDPAVVFDSAHGGWRLAPGIRVDLHPLRAALDARRVSGPPEDAPQLRGELLSYYAAGSLLEGMTGEWVELQRETLRRDATDAICALARRVEDEDPGQALWLLEAAWNDDRHNEALAREIMRCQARLERPDAVHRTLRLLRVLLSEIDERPAPETVELAASLTGQQRRRIERECG